jgi:hypothetical protein
MDALAFTAGALVTGGAIVGIGILLSLAPCTDLSCVVDQYASASLLPSVCSVVPTTQVGWLRHILAML